MILQQQPELPAQAHCLRKARSVESLCKKGLQLFTRDFASESAVEDADSVDDAHDVALWCWVIA